MIRVLIADDHRLFREGVKQILSETPDIKVTGEAANTKEVLNRVWTNKYDVVLLDISMPGRSGLEIIKQLKEAHPELHILVLTMYSEEQYALRALKAGASGYLTKNGEPEDLINAVRKVSTGGKYISPIVAEQLASVLDKDLENPPHKMLSNREYQVMCMIASGKTLSEIAEEMSLSISAVSTYRRRLLIKMKMKNNAEITYYAIKEGLVM